MFLCLKHGKYKGTRTSNECPLCSATDGFDVARKNFVEKARKLHRNRYDYSQFVFRGFTVPGTIICRRHGAFQQSPAVHILHRAKCPKCSGSISKGEVEWLDHLEKTLGISFVRNEILFIGKRSIRPDGFNKEQRIVAEYHGDYWHGNPAKYASGDRNYKAKRTFGHLYRETVKREEIIRAAGYRLITIWESDWEAYKKSQQPPKIKKTGTKRKK